MNKHFQVKEMTKKYEVNHILVFISLLKPSRVITVSYLKMALLTHFQPMLHFYTR